MNSKNRSIKSLSIIGIFAFCIYGAYSLLNYARFRSTGYDLGIFDQVVRQYSKFASPYSQIKEMNIFGDHFHPIIATLAPLYWIWDDPRTLGIAMALLLAISIIPIYLFTEPKFGHKPAILITIAYVFWWPLQGLVNFDFHEIAFSVPLVAWIILGLDRKKYYLVIALSIILLTVREDMGFVVAAVGMVLIFRKKYFSGLMLISVGLLAYWVITSIIIPSYNSSSSFKYWVYSDLGPTLGSAVTYIISNPIEVIKIMFDDKSKVLLWLSLFAPLALLPFLSTYSLLAVPMILSRLLSDRPGTWSTAFQYNCILAPILIMAAVDIIFRLEIRFPKIRKISRWAPQVFLASVIAGTILLQGLFPLGNMLSPSFWQSTDHMTAQKKIVDLIPNGVNVEADDRLVPHLTNRTNVGMIGRSTNYATWSIIDLHQDNSGGGGDGNFSGPTAVEYQHDRGFREIYRQDGVILMRLYFSAYVEIHKIQ